MAQLKKGQAIVPIEETAEQIALTVIRRFQGVNSFNKDGSLKDENKKFCDKLALEIKHEILICSDDVG